PSTRHPGDDGVDAELAHARGQVPEHLVLVRAVRGAERAVADEPDVREPLAERFLEHREDLVAAEEIVPEMTDRLSRQRPETRRAWLCDHRPTSSGPQHLFEHRGSPRRHATCARSRRERTSPRTPTSPPRPWRTSILEDPHARARGRAR